MPKESKERRDAGLGEIRNRLGRQREKVKNLVDAEHKTNEAWKREIEDVLVEYGVTLAFMLAIFEKLMENSTARSDHSPSDKVKKAIENGILSQQIVGDVKVISSPDGGDGVGESFRGQHPQSRLVEGAKAAAAS